MKRVVATVLACAAFLAMLTGTSKRRQREAGSIPKLSIPPTTGWTRTEVAGIRFLTPPGATVTRGDDVAQVKITFDGEPAFGFLPAPVDLDAYRAQYVKDYLMYTAGDGFIGLDELGSGDTCRAIACTTLGAPLCVDVRSQQNQRCEQVIAIVRSIERL